MTESQGFAGVWQVRRWYPTRDDSAEDSSRYHMTAYRAGHDVVFQSLPQEDGSYMLARLTVGVDDNLATGTWNETTSAKSAYGDATYNGACQLLVGKSRREMKGLWVGMGMDHKTGHPKIYTDRLEFKYIGKTLPQS